MNKIIKRFSLLLAMIMTINLGTSLQVFASEINTMDNVEATEAENGIYITSKTGENLFFYKDENIYKIRYEDGTVESWAEDTLISTETISYNSPRVASAWTYLKTDKYATRIDWERLNTLLTVADIISVLDVTYGLRVAGTSVLLSIKPETVYRIDDTYTCISDPLYWRVDSRIYKYSNYTGLLDQFTRYIQW